MLSKNKIFNFFLLSFLSGVFINNILFNINLGLIVLLLFVILFFNFFLYSKKYFIVFLSIMIGFFSGLYLSNFKIISVNHNQNILETYFDYGNHDVIVDIVDIYKKTEFNVEYITEVRQVGNSKVDNNILAIVNVPINLDLKKGYNIRFKSKLYEIDNIDNFDYKNYMLSKNIYFKSYINNFELIEIIEQNKIIFNINNFREKVLDIINKLYPKNEALFLGGILLGARESLPNELKTSFNNSGLTHFIAVSGFNITILVIFFSYLFKYFPLVLRVILITSVIVLFTLIVGDTAPVIRASIMGLIGYYILASGRKGNTWTIILITAGIMIVISPLSLNYDVSLHLSFLAVLGILFTQNFFKRLFWFLPEAFAVKEAFVLTMSAMTFSLPVIMFNFGQLSLISPISNIAMAWTIPFAMLLGFISIIAYYLSPILGFMVGYIDFIFLRYDMLIVNFFGNMDSMLLKFDAGIYKNYFSLLYFIVLGFFVLYFKDNEKQVA